MCIKMGNRRFKILAYLFVTACSLPPSYELAENHPANPQAPAGELRPYSSSLEPEVQESGELYRIAPDRSANKLFACPMHSEVTSSNSEYRCPKCNMKTNQSLTQSATQPVTESEVVPRTTGNNAESLAIDDNQHRGHKH